MQGWMRLTGFIAIIMMNMACSSTPQPLPTNTPNTTAMATPSPTPTATATPSPTPTLSPQDIGMTITPQRTRLAADGRSQMLVTVNIMPPANAPDLNGQPMFFEALGGGQFFPPSVIIMNNQAVSTYQTGEAAGEKTVELVASVDVARIGRASVRTTITLQNEQTEVVFNPQCGYPFVYNRQASIIPVTFTLQTSHPELQGIYGLRFNASNGLIGLSETAMMTNFFTQNMVSGVNTIYFQQPPNVIAGAGRICVGIADRDNIPTRCTVALWGAGGTRLLDLSRAEPFTAYYSEPLNRLPNTVVRLGVGGSSDSYIYWGIAYDVVWGGERLLTNTPYQASVDGMEGRQPIFKRDCVAQRGGKDSIEPFTYYLDPTIQTPLIIEWRASAVGRDAPLQFIDYTVVAHQRVGLSNSSTVIELADGATLTFMPNRYDTDFVVYLLYPAALDADKSAVLVRLRVPTERVNTADKTLVPDENGQILAYSDSNRRNPNMQIQLQNSQRVLHYEYLEQQLYPTNITNTEWVYVLGRVDKNRVRAVTEGNQ